MVILTTTGATSTSMVRTGTVWISSFQSTRCYGGSGTGDGGRWYDLRTVRWREHLLTLRTLHRYNILTILMAMVASQFLMIVRCHVICRSGH